MLKIIKKYILKKILVSLTPGNYFLCSKFNFNKFSLFLNEERQILNLLLERSSNGNVLLATDYVNTWRAIRYGFFMRKLIIEKMIELLNSNKNKFQKTIEIENAIKDSISRELKNEI